MKTLNTLLILILFAAERTFAQDRVMGIVIELCSGRRIEYCLTDHPKLMFDGKVIELVTDESIVEYTPNEFVKLTLDEVTRVSNSLMDGVSLKNEIKLEADNIHFNGFKAGDAIEVFTINGIYYTTYYVEADGAFSIQISSLPQGYSVIKVNKQSIKILRR